MTDILGRLTTALADRYEVERELGAGGMATVYVARDLRHRREVAIKVLRPELAAALGADRFLQEIAIAAKLNHPHILPLYDSGQADGLIFYVMPCVEGESLRRRLSRERQLPIEAAAQIAQQVAAALDYAHRHGVIHRDIKPENILLQDSQALVADFGIALAIRAAGGERLTETGLSVGTPLYMSPEQATGDRQLDARSDIYSLGSVLYEMLAGQPPYTGPSSQAIIAKLLTEPAPRLCTVRDTVPAALEHAVMKALAKLPADRFATAVEFADALGHAGVGAVSAAATIAPPGLAAAVAPTPAARLVDWRVAATGAAVALVLGVIGSRVWRPTATPGRLGRFPVAFAPMTSFGGGSNTRRVALSPDGSVLAFVANGPRGEQIYVRALADLMPQPVAGTEGGTAPFFSPDGREIGFWRPQRLERISVAGGVPTLIADSAGEVAAWLDNGVVVYTDPGRNALRAMTIDGGWRDLVRTDTLQFLVISPLPSNRYVLAAVEMGGGSRAAIVAVSLKDGTMRDVGLRDVVMARYTPSAHVVYQRWGGGPLMAVPFDAARLRVTGEGEPVAPEAEITFRIRPQWDAAGSSIVYAPPAPSQLVLVDRAGHESVLEDEPRTYHCPRFSPDGRRIAFDITDPVSRDVWIVEVSDRRMTRLTVNELANDPFWSPDGRRLAYTAIRGGVRGVFIRSGDGSGVADSLYSGNFSSGSWAPDGRTMVVSTQLTMGLWVVRLDAAARGSPVPGSRATESNPALSPDGRWLAYVSDVSGRREVYVRPFPGPGGRIQVSLSGGAEPVWTRDGGELLYREEAGSARRLIAVAIRTAPAFEVRSRTPLFDASYYATVNDHANYDVSPDGHHFVMIRSAQTPRLNLIENWTAQLRER